MNFGKRCDGKTLLKAAAVAQRCGTTLKRLPPKFPSGWETQCNEHRSDTFRSGSHLPIEKTVIESQRRLDSGVILLSRLLSPDVRLCVGGAVAKPQAAVFLFCVGGRSVKKRAKVFARALAPDHALRKVGACCSARSISNVTVALLFQTLIKMKKGRPVACTRAALGTNRRFLGGVGGTPIS